MSSVRDKANRRISSLKSLLCVGLDSDPDKIPDLFSAYANPVLEFNRAIIRATSDVAVAYKINTAFYEARGISGLQDMENTLASIPDAIMTIADAKRADIGNTSRKYARAFFEHWPFDAVTVAPYMGFDSLEPFFSYEEKLVFVLCLTSNEGSADFEEKLMQDGTPLYRSVLGKVESWSRNANAGIVVGATKSSQLGEIRREAPGLFFLIPGVGAQGGSLEEAVDLGVDADRQSALINVSRALIYPEVSGSGLFLSIDDYELAVAEEAKKIYDGMRRVL
ncbi:orotidine-5'-phosphate decarboxylase [Chlorobium sp. BLA1]|uniref:orotidine-5'-phosphate decarboxylase n=1 Tax=Candidatus Chlorobium masyuteum TaxID=2716876 RepID=UPI00141DFC44|nr:orotidine-5'-phosphate decarboxylase [Candidatus Chlorobium masyuteum]NHQ59560.1 orotidine-5'-phosphate decarboxylase [Candidatus Chlorobium masyuteum]NTU45809.1 orotidine-5'-phosphate decarboxylase [Chlorobiaceae bacterium]